jgi:DDE superfamily endonuclease
VHCRDGGLQPHRTRQFKLSNDPRFVDKLRDVVGLYVDPPAHAIVLSVDEKSQIQALNRTQPGLPLKKGRDGTMTHDYERHGTTTLFATMNVLDGTVIGRNMQHHRHREFIRFLNVIEKQVPPGKTIHAIVDNYAAHKHPNVRRWLERHPRWTFHFTPASASWLNAVEGFFATLTKRRLKRGVFRSLVSSVTRRLESLAPSSATGFCIALGFVSVSESSASSLRPRSERSCSCCRCGPRARADGADARPPSPPP